jgi:hypothetical protein
MQENKQEGWLKMLALQHRPERMLPSLKQKLAGEFHRKWKLEESEEALRYGLHRGIQSN